MKQKNLFISYDEELNLAEISDDSIGLMGFKCFNDVKMAVEEMREVNRKDPSTLQEWNLQDQHVFKTGHSLRTFDAHHYPEQKSATLVLGRKTPILSRKGKIIGMETYAHIWHNPFPLEIKSLLKRNDLSITENTRKILGNSSFSKYNSAQLTLRENECLHLYVRGYSYKSIAQSLRISPRTIESHIQNIKFKLQLEEREEISDFYHQNLAIF